MGMSAYSSATPIADRTCRPASPKTSTIRSEKPCNTSDGVLNPGAQLMNPHDANTSHDAVEGAKIGAKGSEACEAGQPCRGAALRDGQLAAQLPDDEGNVAFAKRAVTAHVDHGAGPQCTHPVRLVPERRRELDPELDQPLLRAHWRDDLSGGDGGIWLLTRNPAAMMVSMVPSPSCPDMLDVASVSVKRFQHPLCITQCPISLTL